MLSLFREAKDVPRLAANPGAMDRTYRSRRNQVLVGSMIGYGLF